MAQREGGAVSATACHNALVSCVAAREPDSEPHLLLRRLWRRHGVPIYVS